MRRTRRSALFRAEVALTSKPTKWLVFALVRALEIIGEAASKVSARGRAEFPDLPWSLMIGMRNRLVHAYFDVDIDTLWDTVIQDVPPLAKRVAEILRG